jgi:hypothetical protein
MTTETSISAGVIEPTYHLGAMVEGSPSVSVVVPTHNRRDLLRLTLGTVLWQEDVDLEVIVVDDGSTDGTVDEVSSIGDPRVRLHRHERPRGVSESRNAGIAEARGQWLAFLDDDDLWAPRKLRSQLDAAGPETTWVYVGDVEMDAQQRVIAGGPPPPPDVVVRRLPRVSLVPAGCSGVIARRSAVESVGGFDPRFHNLADWDEWLRLARTGPPGWVSEPMAAYRVHLGQMSVDIRSILGEAKSFERKHGGRIDRGDLHHYLAYQCLIAGRPRRAVGHLAGAALRGHPVAASRSLATIVRERLGVSEPRRRRPDPGADWRAKAQAWLSEVR